MVTLLLLRTCTFIAILLTVLETGSVYGFWLFSFERYNGNLGNYPTNKRNTSEQLMRRFIYETECFQLSQPHMFKEHFNKVIPLYRSHYSAAHQHQVVQPLTNCSDLQSVTFPSVSKFRSLNACRMASQSVASVSAQASSKLACEYFQPLRD